MTDAAAVLCSWCDAPAVHQIGSPTGDDCCAVHYAQWFAPGGARGATHRRPGDASLGVGVSLYRPRHSSRVTPGARLTFDHASPTH